MKFKKRRRLGPRTWNGTNTSKHLMAQCFRHFRHSGDDKKITPELRKEFRKRVRENNKLAKFLKKHGWAFRQGTNICDGFESYYSLTFFKRNPNESKHIHPNIYFNWHWTDQGGETFWVADMYTFYNYTPDEKYMRPRAQFEIKDITNTHINRIPGITKGLIAATKSQKPSYGNKQSKSSK